jgi:hypothetical protein
MAFLWPSEAVWLALGSGGLLPGTPVGSGCSGVQDQSGPDFQPSGLTRVVEHYAQFRHRIDPPLYI